MKEIDTEASVIWPSWCYTDKVNCNVIKECHKIEKNFDVKVDRDTSKDPRRIIQSPTGCSKTASTIPALAQLLLPTTTIVVEKKMLSERSMLLSGYSNSNTVNSATRNCDTSNTSLSGIALSVQGTGFTITPTTTAAAAAAYLYLEKVKNERISPRVTTAQLDFLKDAIMESSAAVAVAAAMVNNNNSISSNNNNSNHNNNNKNSSGTANNCKNSINSTNSNLVNSQFQNQISKNSTINASNTNTCDELNNTSLTASCNQSLQQQRLQKHHHHLKQQQQQQQQQSLPMNSNHVKKERLSPGTNDDLPTSLTRSRSTTPSSFRGTPPHNSPPDALGSMHNLPTNLLNSNHQTSASSRQSNLSVSSSSVTSASVGIPTDFSTRNYSDFMRSLAAKYNNTNPNDNLKRNILFKATSSNTNAQKKSSTAAQKTSYVNSTSTQLNKEVTITTTSSLPPPTLLPTVPILPSESAIKVSQQNKLVTAVSNAAAACSSNVSPYMTSFLSSLPFSPGIFPHLIDMSSTQALITLARAAKEHEMHNILSFSSQHQKRSANSTPHSPSLNMALQQAAQFISPALIYSVQLQKQQLRQQQQQQYHQQQSQVSRQSSPHLAKISNSTTSSTTSKSARNPGEKVSLSPLDLSSQPPASKRFKAESTSSQSSTDGQMHTTITRRASSSTATTSPSPPPITEKSLNASAIAVPTASVAASLVVNSSSKTTETTTAFTPNKIASSAAITSSVTAAVTVRQCQAQSEELNSWTVDDVCSFVGSIDICAEYVKCFRDQCIDGSGLPLLTEDHLVNSLGMKLGPALKLRSVLAKKLGGPCPCVSCVAQIQQILALQSSASPTDISATKISGSCNSHLAKHTLTAANNGTVKCSSYNSVNKNKNTTLTASTTATTATNTSTANIVSTDATTTNVCNSHGNTSNPTRSNKSSSNINVANFSSPTPPPPPTPPPLPPHTATSVTISQQQQHHLQQKQPEHQQSTLQNICNNKSGNNSTTNRHDKGDSIS